jgi:PleD family two-component response regulator
MTVLLLISDSNADAAFELAERIRLQIAGEIGVTISIGIADYRVNDILDEQIVRADTALYKAKHAGRNRAEVE